MERMSEANQERQKTTPSNHRDFFAKLYGSLEEEYNKKRRLENDSLSLDNSMTLISTAKDSKPREKITYVNATDDDSDDEQYSREGIKECDESVSSNISPGSSPTKDEEISPPRIPPPTLSQLQNRLEVSIHQFL